jgi:hypothetical protein
VQDLGAAHQATDTTDAQAVANFYTLHVQHVGEASVAQNHPVSCNEVSLFE